ncbi:TonB-dependent receptor plug domain-containing protein [Sphingobium nicotianae]|uniref:TonB-dependent receptor n=1 Tax=Sphingobium nicotianae TaxID=2782607 RepID=A0A9X1IR04_9SPHN|nr:TonB-dependent receptor [Sphingobium nicotianae]MBT2187032.1 TonB-dependent receptor [Sphingobium nicotianae]
MRHLSTISRATLAIALVFGAAGEAFAQADAPQDAEAEPQDAIIVTGTRVTGLKASDSPTPVQVLGADLLKRVGQTDLMQALGQNLPSIQVQAFGNDQTAFHPSIKLRGLNPNHTLVLVNGKRRHGTSNVVVTNALWTGGAAPDIGLIPQDSIERLEVLQDGAAAQYGTDAIAGVVNIILKKNASGGVINVTGGKYFAGDGLNQSYMGNVGFAPIEDMYVSVTAEHKVHDYSFRGDVDPRVVDTGQSGSANTGSNGGRTILARYPGVKNFPNYPYVNRIFGDGRMILTNVMYNAGYTGIEGIEIYSFGTLSRRVGRTYQNYRLPNVVYGKSAQASVNTANPTGDIPFKAGFSPQEVLRELDFAITSGVKGEFGNTTVDASLTYGRDTNKVYVEGSANAALYYDSSTLTQNGYSPSDVHDGDFVGSQWVAALDLTHELDIGMAQPLNIAGGLEWRRERYELVAGEPASYYVGSGFLQGGIQSFFGYSPANASAHTREDFSQYLDLSIKPIDPLLIDAAVRHEHYTDFGDTTVFKGTARYDITPTFAIRGTASTGFRAPTLAEGYYSGINVSVSSLSGIFAPNSAGAAFLGLSGLKPEKSTNFSAGVVVRPFDGMTITLDGYSIYLRDRIVQSAGFTGYSNNCKYLPGGYTQGMDVNAAKAAFTGTCTGFISPSVLDALAANGVPIIPVITAINGGASGSLNVNAFVNGLNTVTQGLDFLATYTTDFGDWGRVDWSVAANYNKTRVSSIGAPPSKVNQLQGIFDRYAQSAVTDASPKWRLNYGIFWQKGIFSVSLRESIYGKTKLLASRPANANIDYYQHVGTKGITDIEVGIEPKKGLKLAIGANNLFDIYPDKLPADIRQEQYNLSSTAYISQYPSFSPIGINGGYYYARVTAKF